MLIIGCGGLALQMLDDLEEQFQNELIFWADNEIINSVIKDKYTIINSKEDIKKHLSKNKRFILGLGGCVNRRKLSERPFKYILAFGAPTKSYRNGQRLRRRRNIRAGLCRNLVKHRLGFQIRLFEKVVHLFLK